jgi:hypothetical protein
VLTASPDTPSTPSAVAPAAPPTASATALATSSSPSTICSLSKNTLSFSVYASSPELSAAAVPGVGLDPELEREYHEKLRDWRAKGGNSRGGNGRVGEGRGWWWWWLGFWVAAERWATAAGRGGGRSRRRPRRRIASAMAFVTCCGSVDAKGQEGLNPHVEPFTRSIGSGRLRSTETSYLSEDPFRFSQIAAQGLRFFPLLSPSERANPSHPAHFPARTRRGASPRHCGS